MQNLWHQGLNETWKIGGLILLVTSLLALSACPADKEPPQHASEQTTAGAPKSEPSPMHSPDLVAGMDGETQLPSLQAMLDELQASSEAPPELRAAEQRQNAALSDQDLLAGAVGFGQQAPDFTLEALVGNPVNLATTYAAGPVVLIFLRGGWCPYCNLQLQAMEEAAAEFGSLGARIIAVSPDRPHVFNPKEERPELSFPVLWDEDARVCKQYGIAYEVSPELRELYEANGLDLALRSDMRKPMLPVPTVYLIDQAGLVRFAYTDFDYTQRAEPNDLLAELRLITE